MPSPVGLVVKNGWNSLSLTSAGMPIAVVAHPDLDRLAEIARGHRQDGFERSVARLALALVGGVEAVAEQVEEHARHVLRRQLDRRDVLAVGALQGDVEVLILGAGAMIGEIERFLDERVDVDALSDAAAAARMRQHALDDVVGALAVLGDPLEVAGQHVDDLVDFAALVLVERRERRRGRLLQFVEQLDRKRGEIIDEVERVLDLVRNPGGQLAERGHLLGLDQVGLGRLQIVQRRLGGVARGADLGFGVLALAFETAALDQAVAQHAERCRHRPDLGDIRARQRHVEFPVRNRSHASFELLQGHGDGAHGQRGQAERDRQRDDPNQDREVDRELGPASRRVAPGHGPLLDPIDDLVDFVTDIDNVALRLRHQGVAGGAVVAGEGHAGLMRHFVQDIDFASDGGHERGIDRRDRLQIGVEPRLGGGGVLLRTRELRNRRVNDPILQIAEVLARRIGVLDHGDQQRFLGEALRVRAPVLVSAAGTRWRGSRAEGLKGRSAVRGSTHAASRWSHVSIARPGPRRAAPTQAPAIGAHEAGKPRPKPPRIARVCPFRPMRIIPYLAIRQKGA